MNGIADLPFGNPNDRLAGRLRRLTQVCFGARERRGETMLCPGQPLAEKLLTASSEMGSANSAPILSPAVHLTTALARSRPGSISQTRDPTSKRPSQAAMKPRSEMLSTFASMPLAPSSRILASTSPGSRAKRLRSDSSSAMRALIIPKLISTRQLLQRGGEGQSNPAVLDPPDLGRDEPLVEQLQGQALADIGHVREDDHRARFRDVDQPHDVLAAAKLEHCGVRDCGMAQLSPLVDRTLRSARNHSAVETETGRHS